MIHLTEDIQPLTTFRNNSVEMLKQLRRTGRPVVLTVNGKTAAVVQDAEAYQRLLDLAARNDAGEGIRQGDADVAAGRTQAADKVFTDLRKRYAVSR